MRGSVLTCGVLEQQMADQFSDCRAWESSSALVTPQEGVGHSGCIYVLQIQERYCSCAHICKWDVNMHSVVVAIKCVTACISPHGSICADSWPPLFGLQVLNEMRGRELLFIGSSLQSTCLFESFLSCLSFICYKSFWFWTTVSHIFKYSWDLNVHCICITYLHCIFVQLGGCTVISQCLEWQLIKFNYDLVTLPDFPARGNKKFVMFYWNHKWPFHLIDFTWVEIPSAFIKLKVTNVYAWCIKNTDS